LIRQAGNRALIQATAVVIIGVLGASGMTGADSTMTARDGVGVDHAGNPFYSTFSLCAIDQSTGESGVVVTTRVPFVGRAVPWARAGVGAVATQSWTIVEYGRRGLDLMEGGMAPSEALARLLADDAGRELRQLGLIDMQGRSVAHTGEENGLWAGSRQGDGYTVQGNVLVGPEVVDAVADHFESTASTGMALAERMLLALQAGQKVGGDKRWGYFQSAAIRVADPNDPGRGGDHLSLSIDVGEHENPVAEMLRIYYRTGRRLGYRELSELKGADVVELKRLLHGLGFWGADLEAFPESPKFDVDRELSRIDPVAFQEALKAYRERSRLFSEKFGDFDAAVIESVDKFREQHGMKYVGNPNGLVDHRLIEVLKREYYSREKR
jgi:uncharacterized Ntn-hydrolase superfamily protein